MILKICDLCGKQLNNLEYWDVKDKMLCPDCNNELVQWMERKMDKKRVEK